MQHSKKPIVMIVEDETPLLLAIQRRLEKSGFSCISATTAEQAIDYLKTIKQRPDLIWLDFYLPGKSGLEFLVEIKKIPKLASIPVFIISNTAGPKKVEAMMALGANKYFIKAEKRLEDIILEIRKFIKKGA